ENNITLIEHFNYEGNNYKIVRNEELEKDINIASYLEKSFRYILSVLPQNKRVIRAWLNPKFKENYFEIVTEKMEV
ncbi:MAG: hypothetical protein K2F59_04900, partial [Eubacteriales bacterium]|nr:hypothetical protein [Eubacteriales bacterium]